MHKVTATYMAQIVLTKGILMLSQTVIRVFQKVKNLNKYIHLFTQIQLGVHYMELVYSI